MSVTRRLVLSALCGCALGCAALPVETSAQLYEAARRSLDFSPDPTARSPRLLGMGRLGLASDYNNRIDLWDFAGNPTGVLDADSSTTFELRPATTSTSGVRRPIGTTRERQYLAGREIRMGFEAWRRTDTTTVYGFYGDVGTLRTDRPFDDLIAVRRRFEEPRLAGVLNGRMPFFQSERMRYALEGFYAAEKTADEYRTLFSNDQGEYLGQRGDLVGPPEFFTPDEYSISTLGAKAGVSYRAGPWLTAALVGGGSSSRIEGENASLIHTSGTGEDRPYYLGQASAVGKMAGLEYGADGRAWTSSSEERWVFTLKAGINQEPFSGRGKKLDREERGTEARARLRWTLGSLELNAAAGRRSSQIEVAVAPPPDSGSYNFADPADRQRFNEDLAAYQASFNYFRNLAANRDGADSLALPDSVTNVRTEEEGWSVGYGAAWKIPGGRGTVGVEYHFAISEQDEVRWSLERTRPDVYKDVFESGIVRRRTWDVRSGLEYAWTAALRGRVGYAYRWDDLDEFKERNEITSHLVSLGFGLAPAGSLWSLDGGWALEWLQHADDPTEPRETRQQLAAQLRWVF